MLNCLDISNWTGLPTAEQFSAWKAAGIELVVVQAILPPPGAGFPPCVDQQQAQAVIDAGLRLGVYVFHWFGTRIAHDNASRFAGYGFPVERWYGDFEDTAAMAPQQRETEILDLLAHLDTLGDKRASAPYSGAWWVNGYLPANSTVFAGRTLWLSKYDGVAELDQAPLAGAEAVTLKQFLGTSTLAGVQNVDLNVAAESEFSDFPNVPPDPIPPDDPCADVAAKRDSLIVTVADIADRLGDALLAECKRTSVRKGIIRAIVQQMESERASSIGPRP